MSKLSFLLLVVVLAVAGGWYFASPAEQTEIPVLTSLQQATSPVVPQEASPGNSETATAPVNPQSGSAWADAIVSELQSLLAASRWQDAMATINRVYSRARADELDRFKAVILQHAEQLVTNGAESAASSLLKEYTQTFDDLIAWRRLAEISAILKDWDSAVTALLASSAQENQPQAFEESLRLLVRAGNYVRASLERQGDEAGILALYQRIYDQHPQYPRFQLELANAHLRLNDPDSARPLLEALAYDPELGAIAEETLARLDARQEAALEAAPTPELSIPADRDSGTEIVVPLVRSGNSLLVDVSVNAEPMRLLLDTGASITALSATAIQNLGLRPLGTTITLNTANGTTQSRLFRANRLQLGRLQLNNMVVAEIDLSDSKGIAGLLGTDVLNQMNDRFSYLIDDQSNALIFRQR